MNKITGETTWEVPAAGNGPRLDDAAQAFEDSYQEAAAELGGSPGRVRAPGTADGEVLAAGGSLPVVQGDDGAQVLKRSPLTKEVAEERTRTLPTSTVGDEPGVAGAPAVAGRGEPPTLLRALDCLPLAWDSVEARGAKRSTLQLILCSQ